MKTAHYKKCLYYQINTNKMLFQVKNYCNNEQINSRLEKKSTYGNIKLNLIKNSVFRMFILIHYLWYGFITN